MGIIQFLYPPRIRNGLPQIGQQDSRAAAGVQYGIPCRKTCQFDQEGQDFRVFLAVPIPGPGIIFKNTCSLSIAIPAT